MLGTAHLCQPQIAAPNLAGETAEAALAETELRAPFAGVVTVRHREPGEIVSSGSPVLTIMNRDDRWVRIYVPETRIGAVRLSGHASITTDSFRGRSYEGKVEFIASEAEFTPKTVQTRKERTKIGADPANGSSYMKRRGH